MHIVGGFRCAHPPYEERVFRAFRDERPTSLRSTPALGIDDLRAGGGPMKALLLEAPRSFRRIETESPGPPGPGEALVRVHRVGVCGTDISGYLGKMPFFSYPRIPGHELGVEVLEVGEGVADVRPGNRCSVEPYINDPNSYASR